MCNCTCKPQMLDEWSGRFFEATMGDIQNAVNECNAMMIDEGELDLNTFYDRIGLAPIPMGMSFGWSGESMRIIFGSIVKPDGWPALTMSFRNDPKPELGRR